MPNTPRRIARSLLLAAGVMALFPAAGCNILGPAYYFAVGPDKVPAVYELDEKKSTVIFIDDRVPYTTRSVREQIGRSAEEALLEAKAVKDVVSSKAIQAVVARERFGKPMGIADIGKAVGADVVIYAWVDGFTLSKDGQTYTPSAAMRIKVIDVATKERLFPKPDQPEAWYTFAVDPPAQQGFSPSTAPEIEKARQDVARYIGLSLARLFFEHEQSKQPARLDEDPNK